MNAICREKQCKVSKNIVGRRKTRWGNETRLGHIGCNLWPVWASLFNLLALQNACDWLYTVEIARHPSHHGLVDGMKWRLVAPICTEAKRRWLRELTRLELITWTYDFVSVCKYSIFMKKRFELSIHLATMTITLSRCIVEAYAVFLRFYMLETCLCYISDSYLNESFLYVF